ncbi:MAG: type II toxin-antitoxin system RelE/ParE family toxin [SAR324 cluster bacterium]|nr:type II toxin-antitoxin system RelE/ParE family toxin [SAR324 cluster bacterium]MCZ6532868.1 type II toxin-antitoxin system RelE/ParE family toxin [SAR324 cluster bacterium]MCZ6729811.1 type II toxin-antitoxin system RelE/ParE family toxin [SAR324 cluster bacterium]
MIRSFRHKGLRQLYETGSKGGINASHIETLIDILTALEAAEIITDLNAPEFRLHELKGRQKGRWSIKVSGAWRITFEFREGLAISINYEQYH